MATFFSIQLTCSYWQLLTMKVLEKHPANPRARRGSQPADAPPAPPAPPKHGTACGRPCTHAAHVEDASGEEFDLENISADEEEESVPPCARTRVHAPVDPSAIDDDPLLNTVNCTGQDQTPPDIDYFFNWGGGIIICKSCRR
jgi:hypothetical protein